MAATLMFDVDAVRRLVRHTMAGTRFRLAYAETVERPALWLVKDDGIYLVSNNATLDLLENGTSFVAYAKGYDPNTDGDVWHKCRDALGGDDMVEVLGLDPATAAAVISEETTKVVVKVTAKNISLSTMVRAAGQPPQQDLAAFRKDACERLQKAMQGSLIFLRKPGNKVLRTAPLRQEANLKATYPRAVILNAMPLDKAVALYVSLLRR